MLAAPFYYRMFTTGEAIDVDAADQSAAATPLRPRPAPWRCTSKIARGLGRHRLSGGISTMTTLSARVTA
jgi:hypothetical protein